jgi:hypothetical protein
MNTCLWSYGKKIGGRHLCDMITLALKGQPVMVTDGAGGSLLDPRIFSAIARCFLPRRRVRGLRKLSKWAVRT